MKFRTLVVSCAVPALLFASSAAHAVSRPTSATFGSTASAPLKGASRQSLNVGKSNELSPSVGMVSLTAAILLALVMLLVVQQEEPVSPA